MLLTLLEMLIKNPLINIGTVFPSQYYPKNILSNLQSSRWTTIYSNIFLVPIVTQLFTFASIHCQVNDNGFKETFHAGNVKEY